MAIEQLPRTVVPFSPDGRAKMREMIDAMAGDSAEFHAQMVAWLGKLPTSDPSEAGQPFLDTGVLTVSSGGGG